MTEQRAIKLIKEMKHLFNHNCREIDENTAIDMAISALEKPTVELAFNDDKKYVMINGELYQKAKFDFPEGTHTVSVKRPRLFNQQNSGWIPCSERQPDKTDNYLAYCESGDGTATLTFINVEHYNSGNDWTGFYKGQKRRREVIAWQPLPEPYNGKQIEV